jgi:hypothetical protein
VVCSRHTNFQPENLTGRDCLRNPGVGGIMILKWTLKNETVNVQAKFIKFLIRTLNAMIKLYVPPKVEMF